MKQYQAVTVEIISLEAKDIILSSGNLAAGDPYLTEPGEWINI